MHEPQDTPPSAAVPNVAAQLQHGVPFGGPGSGLHCWPHDHPTGVGLWHRGWPLPQC